MKYKVKLYIHKSVVVKIDDDIIKCRSYFLKHNIDIIFDIEKTEVAKDNALIKLMKPQNGKVDCVMYIYNRGTFKEGNFNGLAFGITKTLRGIYLATSIVDDNVDYTWKSFCHEILHTIIQKFQVENPTDMLIDPLDGMMVNGVWKPYYKNEELDAPDGNFAEAFRRIAVYFNEYKYFSKAEQERWKLKPELWRMLDKAREIAGIPFIINSGLRTDEVNEDVGGVADSSHLKGLAVDLRALNNTQHYLIIKGLLGAGFRRISRKYPNHIHADIDPDKVQDVLF